MSEPQLLRVLVLIAALTVPILSGCHEEAALENKSNAYPVVAPPDVPAVTVKKLRLDHLLEIPGELKAFQNVPIEAKVQGYVSSINVDRGSKLKMGDKILTISCPELDEHLKEEEAKTSAAISDLRKGESAMESLKSKRLEAQARLDADRLTLERLQATAKRMPGSVAVNDIDVQSKTVESDSHRIESMNSEVIAAKALVEAAKSNVTAAKKVEQSVKSLQSYLTVTAPFDGVITERNVHVGSMVGPQENQQPLVRIREVKVLRLVVAMPESSVAGVKEGTRIPFSVPAYPGTSLFGTVTRPAFAIDPATRTMPVELDVNNSDNKLEPGMFATVHWRISRPVDTLFVPASAVATDLKGSFVNRIKNGICKRVPVEKGQPMEDLVEVIGELSPGDRVALRGTDELKDGTHLNTKVVLNSTQKDSQ